MTPNSRPWVLVAWLPVLLILTARAQDKPAAAAPTIAVQQLLDQANATIATDRAGALALADRALSVARESSDIAGAARSQQTRAALLLDLKQPKEAQAALHEAEAGWARIDDGPGQIEAIGWQAVVEAVTKGPRTEELLLRAIGRADSETKRPRAAVASLVKVGNAFYERSLTPQAAQAFESAVGLGEKVAPESLEIAWGLNGLGSVMHNRRDPVRAVDFYTRALVIREKLAPDSVDVAVSLNGLGNVATARGDVAAADGYYRRALSILEKIAPDSREAAVLVNNLGNILRTKGDLAGARMSYERALTIIEKLTPDSVNVAVLLANLGVLTQDQGDLPASRSFLERALKRFEKTAPNSLSLVTTLQNLGNLSRDEGNLAQDREYQERALALAEKLAPGSLEVAASFEALGVIARLQGDLAAARGWHERALAIREKLAPNSLLVADTLGTLGLVFLAERDLRPAGDFIRRALAISEKLAPKSIHESTIRANLGNVLHDQGDLAGARDHYSRALEINERLAPNSIRTSTSLHNLATVAQEQGDYDAARIYGGRAFQIRERLAPDSLLLASSLNLMGVLAHQQGDLATAVAHSARAWSVLRRQASLVSGDEARQAFQGQHNDLGSQLLRFQLDFGRVDDAFATLEEGRAQALLTALAERGVVHRLSSVETWRAYEVAQAESNRAGKVVESTGNAVEKARMSLDAELAQQSAASVIEEKRRALQDRELAADQARQVYTRTRVEAERRWADARRSLETAIPTPISAAEARRALPEGTLVVAFAVGDKDSTLFIVRRDAPVQSFAVAVPANELAARVDFVRRTASREAGLRGLAVPGSDEVRIEAARDLFQKLFPPPTRDLITRAERLLISPDGVLWDLPFAALVINTQGDAKYLGLEKPLAYTQSLTAWAQVSKTENRPGFRPSVLAVGNPLYYRPSANTSTTRVSDSDRRADGELALLSRNGEIPAPLPYAEEEATRIAALYGLRPTIGRAATEAWFRSRAPEADIIHLATHGYFNPTRAVSSGVRLAVPERTPGAGETDNDGALQAWEIFTQLRLHADLVVLSACETGLGAIVPGEGLVGLTRAFQAAGAASIVATQWSVPDRSTSVGMVAFHESLRRGVSKDEALRQALRKLANEPATRHPYYWAPFVLVGDSGPLRPRSDR